MKFINNEQLIEYLNGKSSQNLKDFNSKILVSQKPVIGVKIPDLRNIAKSCAKDDFVGFAQVLTENTFEEIMLFGMAIGYADLPFETRLDLIEEYLNKADNWAHIDCALSNYKFINKQKSEFFPFVGRSLASGKEFAVRFGFVSLLDYYVEEDYLGFIFTEAEKADCGPYYVSMAVAWLLSVCYVKYTEKTQEFLCSAKIDDSTYNRTVQKIIDSKRVDKHLKEFIKKTKRKSTEG